MTAFRDILFRLRKTYVGKQYALAASLGCTEAAVSFWEHGRRLPNRMLLPRIVVCLRENGAEADEIAELELAYEGHRQRRGGAYHGKF
jgi:hypothetical protein